MKIWIGKLLGFVSPLTKYIYLIALVGAFVAGGGITRLYYTQEIAQNERAVLAQTTKYLERVMELDKTYSDKIKDINQRLVDTQGRLNDELAKDEYVCPIPDAGIGLLNDAIKASKPSDSGK